MNSWKPYREPEIDIDTGELTSPPERKKKTTPEMKQVFELFDNPERKIWHMRPIEREAAQVLFDTYGIELLKKRLERIKKDGDPDDPHFPIISSPSRFLNKMPSLDKRFG